jgi:hypothetical protein
MKIIRLAASASLLDVDKYCANHGYKIIRFVIGREAKKRNGMTTKPERAHLLLVAPVS